MGWCLHWEAGHKPDTMGGHRGEESTNIMSALPIKLCPQITIQLSDHQNLQIFTMLNSFPFSVGRTAELWETSLGLQVIIVILIGLPGSPSPPVNTILTVLILCPALTGNNCHNCSLNEALFVPITPAGLSLSQRKPLLPGKVFPLAVSQCLGQVFSLLHFTC